MTAQAPWAAADLPLGGPGSRLARQPGRALALAEAQGFLSAGVPVAEVSRLTGLTESVIHHVFNSRGRLLLARPAARLLNHRQAVLAEPFQDMPRALRRADVIRLGDVLRRHAQQPVDDLRQASLDEGVDSTALDFILDGNALRDDRLAALPEDQMRELLAARAGLRAVLVDAAEPRPQPGAEGEDWVSEWIDSLAADEPAAPVARAAEPPPTANVRGQPPLNAARVQRLVEAQALLAGGLPVKDTARQARVDQTVLRDMFDNSGRLRLSARATALLDWREPATVDGLRDLPRALTNGDTHILAEVLRRYAAGGLEDVRQASMDAGVQPAAIAYLFDEDGWLDAGRVESLPEEQRKLLRSAISAGEAAPRPDAPPPLSALPSRGQAPAVEIERANRLADAQARLVAGEPLTSVAKDIGLERSWFRKIFDDDGRLVLSAAGQRLLDIPDEATAARFAALPRALWPADLRRLVQVVQRHAQAPLPDLMAAAQEARVSPQAIEHLFDDDGRLLQERLASLPDAQRRQLDTPAAPPARPLARADRPTPDQSHVERLMQARALMATGLSASAAAKRLHVDAHAVNEVFDDQGRLRLSARSAALLNDPTQGPLLRELPRALTGPDLRILSNLLRRAGADEIGDLREACMEARMQAQAVDYLFDADGWLDADRVDTLPPEQHQALRCAAALGQNVPAAPPPLWMLRPTRRDPAQEHQRAQSMAAIQEALAAQRPMSEVAGQAGIAQRSLRNYFNSSGRLMLNGAGQSLLDTADAALAAHFAALPRALQPRDLRLLGPLLSQHAEAPLPDLLERARAAGVGAQALAHLFDDQGRLLPSRLEALPEQQQRQLRGGNARTPAQAPAHRTAAEETTARDQAATVAPMPDLSAARPVASSAPAAARATVPQASEPTASAVLQFFRRHSHPAQALVDAQAAFAISRPVLLQLLARTGVTELEAYGGRLPDAAELWRRLRDGVRRDSQVAAPSGKRPAEAGTSAGPATRRRLDDRPDDASSSSSGEAARVSSP